MALVDLKSDLTWYGTPPAVNYLPDKASGATGFTDSVNATQYIGVANDSYTYPVTVRGGRLMQPKSAAKFPGPQNFFDDNLSGARGFTLNKGEIRQYEKSEFLGIRGLTYTYPTTLANGDRLMKPRLSTSFPGPQNFFADVNATGFTENMWKPGQSKKSSQFKGITEGNYQYPANLNETFNSLNVVDNSYNTTYMPQPYIVRGMQRKGKANEKPQYWGFGSKSGFDDGLIRGGAVTVADRVIADTKRIAKFMASPKGLLWIVKQFGLGLSNPKVESNLKAPVLQTRIHTGLTSLLSVAGSPFGLHFTTHGLPFVNELASYEKVQNSRISLFSPNNVTAFSTNRLVALSGKYRSVNLVSRIGNSRAFGLITKSLEGITNFPGLLPMSGLAGPQSVYGIGYTGISRKVDTVTDAINNARNNGYNPNYTAAFQYASLLHGYNTTALAAPSFGQAVENVDDNELSIKSTFESKVSNNTPVTVSLPTIAGVSIPPVKIPIPNATPGNGEKDISNASNVYSKGAALTNTDVRNYLTVAYSKIPKKSNDKTDSKGDFRNLLNNDTIGFTGKRADSDYIKNSIDAKYGFGTQGKVGANRTDPNSFGSGSMGAVTANDYQGKGLVLKDTSFRGDKINATDIINSFGQADPYTNPETKDLIRFFFEDGTQGKNIMLFRAILTGLTDSFSPGWDKVDIMGRPDGAYLYTSFERTVSFNFTVAATSRAEMIPLWRKLNYLATYTMPNVSTAEKSTGRASGPFMRMTVGDMYNRVPGFITSLSYTVPDESSWDIAEDRTSNGTGGKQLPMVIEVAMSYTIINDTRPQLKGQVFGINNWLS
jgi:hypothetical protein